MNAIVRNLYRVLLEPRTEREETRRKELILNVLLLASLTMAAAAFGLDQLEQLRHGLDYDGAQSFVVPGTAVCFLILLVLSRRRAVGFPSFVLVALYYLAATYCLYRWGIDVPIGLLLYALVITLSGILGTPRIALACTLLLVLTLSLLYALGSIGIVHPDLIWKTRQVEFADVAVICLVFSILFFVSWLSRREIEHSLLRALDSEDALRTERDALEMTVETRTSQLRAAQRAETAQLYELAQVGKLSSSLLHDMLTPLSTVSLTLERLQEGDVSGLLERAVRNTKKIEQFVAAARRQLGSERRAVVFSPYAETAELLELHADRLGRRGIECELHGEPALTLLGDPIRFHRLAGNLLGNATDAYAGMPAALPRPIEIRFLATGPNELTMTVRDQGSGMPPEVLERIFEPFFTTKPADVGSGIGLKVCKEIVEQDFAGLIEVESTVDVGTTVKVRLYGQDGTY